MIQSPLRDIVTDILALEKYLNRPHPVAIWIVDAPQLKDFVLNHFVEDVDLRIGEEYRRIRGIPVYEWWTWAEQEGDKKPDLPFLRPECRGVWIEMKNAPHIVVGGLL